MIERKETIMITVSLTEKTMIKKKAKELGLNNMSAYLRMLVHQDFRMDKEKRGERAT